MQARTTPDSKLVNLHSVAGRPRPLTLQKFGSLADFEEEVSKTRANYLWTLVLLLASSAVSLTVLYIVGRILLAVLA